MRSAAAVAAAVLCSAGLGAAIPGAQPPAEPPPGRRAPEDRAAVRARLERRLEEVRRNEQRITEALERLEAGAPLEEVRAAGDGPRLPRQGGRPEGRRSGGRPPEDPTPAETIAFIERHAPELAARLRAWRERDPQGADRMLERLRGRVRELIAERDPRLREARIAEFAQAPRAFEAGRRLGELVRSGAPEAEIAAARAALRVEIARQFDLRLERHQAEIVALEERVARVRTEVGDYTARRDQVIDEAVSRVESRARSEDPGGPGEPDPVMPPGSRDR